MNEIVLHYARMGIMVVPLVAGEKKPLRAYANLRGRLVTEQEMMDLWQNCDATDMAIDCGRIEVIDIDRKNSRDFEIVEDFLQNVRQYDGLYEKLRIEGTPSAGAHLLYLVTENEVRSSAAPAHFAQEQTDEEVFNGDKIKYKPVIDLCATGHLCRIWPTPGISVINDVEVGYITQEEREFLLRLAESYNEKPPVVVERIESKRMEALSDRPGDRYSAECDIHEVVDLMENHGWAAKRSGGRVLLRRPGATTKNFDGDILLSRRTFIAYSSSVCDFEPGRPYSMFDILIRYQFGGDVPTATKWVAEKFAMRFDARSERPSVARIKEQEEDTDEDEVDELLEEALALKVVYGNKPKETFSFFFVSEIQRGMLIDKKTYPIGSSKMLTVVSGEEKARKTVVACAITASALSGHPVCGFLYQMPTDRSVLFVDTEQANFWAYRSLERILEMSGGVGVDRLNYFALRSERTQARRLKMTRKLLKKFNPGMIVIDGATDMVDDYNDLKQSGALLLEMMAWSVEHDAMIISVVHLNRGDKTPRGHIGSESMKKADVVIRCTLSQSDNNFTDCSFTQTRGQRPPSFSFGVHGDNIPFLPGSADDPVHNAPSHILKSFKSEENRDFLAEAVEEDGAPF